MVLIASYFVSYLLYVFGLSPKHVVGNAVGTLPRGDQTKGPTNSQTIDRMGQDAHIMQVLGLRALSLPGCLME